MEVCAGRGTVPADPRQTSAPFILKYRKTFFPPSLVTFRRRPNHPNVPRSPYAVRDAVPEHTLATEPLSIVVSPPEGDPRDDALLPEYQTKVPLYGRDHISSRKVQAMKQAKDRKKQLARLGPAGNLDSAPLGPHKLEPELVSEGGGPSPPPRSCFCARL